MFVKDDHSKLIYSIDVNKSVEYFCESAPMVSDRPSTACNCSLEAKGVVLGLVYCVQSLYSAALKVFRYFCVKHKTLAEE